MTIERPLRLRYSQRMARHLIPDNILQVIALFEGPLAEVKFPETDRDTLVALLDALRATTTELDETEKQMAQLQKTLVTQLELLGRKAEQGLQYGRVYAEGDVPNNIALQKQIARVSSYFLPS